MRTVRLRLTRRTRRCLVAGLASCAARATPVRTEGVAWAACAPPVEALVRARSPGLVRPARVGTAAAPTTTVVQARPALPPTPSVRPAPFRHPQRAPLAEAVESCAAQVIFAWTADAASPRSVAVTRRVSPRDCSAAPALPPPARPGHAAPAAASAMRAVRTVAARRRTPCVRPQPAWRVVERINPVAPIRYPADRPHARPASPARTARAARLVAWLAVVAGSPAAPGTFVPRVRARPTSPVRSKRRSAAARMGETG